jgi:hypothetical protein
MKYRDIVGRDLSVGDAVCYATSEADMSRMRVGRIDELKRRKPRYEGAEEGPPTLIITALGDRSFDNGFYRLKKRTTIAGRPSGRFDTVVKIEANISELIENASDDRWHRAGPEE